MKPYFSKLLTEQERAGSKMPSRKTGVRLPYDPDSDYDDQPKRMKMCRRNRQSACGDYNWKELTDVLSPLRGFLRKSVGRPWDDVYSELCRNLDRRSVSGLHVFQHLRWEVQTNTFMKNGQVWYYWRGGDSESPIHGSGDFYVHPTTGILCEDKNRISYRTVWREKQKRERVDKIKINDNQSYELIDGIWYHATYSWVEILPGTKNIAVHKKQLNKKELCDLGLKNGLAALQKLR